MNKNTKPVVSTMVEEAVEKFQDKYFKDVEDKLGWLVPKIALLWTERAGTGEQQEWEDTENEILEEIRQSLTTLATTIYTELEKEIEGMKVKNGIPYTESNPYEDKRFAWNQALSNTLTLIAEKKKLLE